MRGGKILVAGATGRVGSAAVEELLQAGFEVRAMVRTVEKGKRFESLGAEVAVGDVTAPYTLPPAVRGCSGVFSALAAGPGRGAFEVVEYRGNLDLLSAARSAGIRHFVYNSVLFADHPLAQNVGAFREKARFERELVAAEDVAQTILRSAMLMATLDLILQGPVAFVPGRQANPVSWIAPRDVARTAVRAFEKDVTGLHEIAGPDRITFDEAFGRLSRARGKRISVLHVPLSAMRIPVRAISYIAELANMMAFFDAAGFATDSAALRETFDIHGLTIEGWVREDRSLDACCGDWE